MTDAEMERAWRKDMTTDSKLAEARRLLNALAADFSGKKIANEMRSLADKLWEERQRIVRRWD